MFSSHPTTSYTALQEKDEIRLLYLHPGSGTSPLKCTLHHVQLSDCPRYEALSYQWGSESSPSTIAQTSISLFSIYDIDGKLECCGWVHHALIKKMIKRAVIRFSR
jgi:hypothetical protein